MRRLTNIRHGEGRNTWGAFALLFILIASHSVLETARDALFLADIPASNLPWVYLAIAAVSLIVTQLQTRLGSRLAGRAALSLWTALASAITFGFWLLGDRFGTAGLYALYIWSGLLTTLVLVHFWILLGDLFSVTQAKRLYGLIGAGSVVGAITGSAIAGGLATILSDPSHLLAVTGCGLAIAAAMPVAIAASARAIGRAAPAESTSLLEAARFVASKPYARRVVMLLLVAAATVTVADYLFKSIVAANVAPERLGTFFGAVYLGLNILSLVAQLFLVSWLVRRFTISIALSVLPVLLFVGGGLMLATGGLVAALAIKGADGSLRYSLHRTSTELLFVPLSSAARRRVKAFIDVVSQRGGQAVASLAILALTALGLGPRVLAVVLIVLAFLWVGGALDIHRFYLDIFRNRLDRNSAARLEEFPDLDLGSLETLIAALDSPDDPEVLAALDVLERERKVRLVPALILYHPSEDVVSRALELFIRHGRTSVVPLCDRLIETHESEKVRAAAVAARAALDFDEQRLRMRLSEEESEQVRATIMVNLIAAGAIVGSDARDTLNAMLENGSDEALIALADAIGQRRAIALSDTVAAVAQHPSGEVRSAAAGAFAMLGGPENLDRLVLLLGSESSRRRAERGLLESGEDGLAALERAFEDETLGQRIRWQIPKAISAFDPENAIGILLGRLPVEWDGMVRYRAIRSLEMLAKHNPEARFDREKLQTAIEETVRRCYRYIDRRASLTRGAKEEPSRETAGHALLAQILADKESNAVGRVFRLLGLAYPSEEFDVIYRTTLSDDSSAKQNSIELVENLLKPPLRGAVSGLIDDLNPAERLGAGADFYEPRRLNYEQLLEEMLESSSHTVQDVTAYHIGELRLTRFRDRVRRLSESADENRTDLPFVVALLDDPSRPDVSQQEARDVS